MLANGPACTNTGVPCTQCTLLVTATNPPISLSGQFIVAKKTQLPIHSIHPLIFSCHFIVAKRPELPIHPLHFPVNCSKKDTTTNPSTSPILSCQLIVAKKTQLPIHPLHFPVNLLQQKRQHLKKYFLKTSVSSVCFHPELYTATPSPT